jgi:hypothetical protein
LKEQILQHLDELSEFLKGYCSQKEEEKKVNSEKKSFSVYFGDNEETVEGEAFGITDDGMLRIFSDVVKGKTEAIFKNWDAIFVQPHDD